MPRLLPLTALALLLALACGGLDDAAPTAPAAPAPAPPEPPKDTWFTLESAEGKFRAEFPSEPASSSSQVPAQDMTLQMTTYSAADGGLQYMLATADYPSDRAIIPQKVLDGARDGAVSNINGRLVKETPLEVDGHPGRRLAVQAAAEGVEMYVDCVIILVGHRLYQALVVRPSFAAANDAAVERFLGSLRPTP